MTLMLSNDDGVHAIGLTTLQQTLAPHYDLRTIAPDRDCSGISNALTLDRPLHPILHTHTNSTQEAPTVISLNGTPTDCVHLGVHEFYQHQCERLIAGINAGANLGDDVLYSGTVAAAIEGRFLDKTPIAISLVGRTHFATAAQVLLDLLPKLEQLCLPANHILNINVPDCPYAQLQGIEITRLGHRGIADNPVQHTNPRGKQGYWISVAGKVADAGVGTDFYAIEQRRVSLTPIQLDMSATSQLPTLRTWLQDTQ